MIVIIITIYHDQNDGGYNRDGHVDEYGEPPLAGDCVHRGEQQRAAEVEHVGGGHEGAAELGLAHLADVRGKRAAREADAQTHQYRARVHGGHVVGVEQHRERHHVRYVGDDHAVLVTESRQHQRGHQAAQWRAQVHQATCMLYG